jgi:transcriptional regulator with XRE-family HTH domain
MEMLLRNAIGRELRDVRIGQHRSLREVAGTAQVSIGYLSEIERGQKEVSSELLQAISHALQVEVSEVLAAAVAHLQWHEKLARKSTSKAA